MGTKVEQIKRKKRGGVIVSKKDRNDRVICERKGGQINEKMCGTREEWERRKEKRFIILKGS